MNTDLVSDFHILATLRFGTRFVFGRHVDTYDRVAEYEPKHVARCRRVRSFVRSTFLRRKRQGILTRCHRRRRHRREKGYLAGRESLKVRLSSSWDPAEYNKDLHGRYRISLCEEGRKRGGVATKNPARLQRQVAARERSGHPIHPSCWPRGVLSAFDPGFRVYAVTFLPSLSHLRV